MPGSVMFLHWAYREMPGVVGVRDRVVLCVSCGSDRGLGERL